MPAPKPELDPGAILEIAFAFWSSKVLLTAVQFGLFTKLGDRQMTGSELGAQLGLHSRGITWIRREFRTFFSKMAGNHAFAPSKFAAVNPFS